MIDTELTWHQKVAALSARLERTPTLEELLDLNRTHQMSEAELRVQRDSFVRAQMGFGSDADEAAYRTALDAGDPREIELHEAASQLRMQHYDQAKGGLI